jgi:hypothetical protein
MPSILSEKDLMTVTGYKKRSLLERCLRSQKIKFFYGRGGQIWTTSDALNAGLGLIAIQQDNNQSLDFT